MSSPSCPWYPEIQKVDEVTALVIERHNPSFLSLLSGNMIHTINNPLSIFKAMGLWWLCSLSQNDGSGMKANLCLLAVFISVSESILQSLIHHLSLHQGISLDQNLPLPFSSNITQETKALPPENEQGNVQSQDTLVWKVTWFIPLPTAWLASELDSPQFLLLLLKCLAPAASAWKLQHCPQFKQLWALAYPNKVFFQANTNNKNRCFKLKQMYILLVGCPDIKERETKLLPPA